MKIEKISETQVKFILTRSDLEERDIQINELTYGSEKAHKLFQEMMRQALEECAFESENTPLMVEAMPVDASHVVVVVTKVAGSTLSEELSPMVGGDVKAASSNVVQRDDLAIFSFGRLDEVANASKRLYDYFMGQSRLYKCDSRYFLVIEEDAGAFYAMDEYQMVLTEYGVRHFTNSISEYYLVEHGEVIIDCQAVEKLAVYL